jgi:drug/metabolite transporter (DMT)-like permease
MDWLTLALIGSALNGGVSVVDKYVIAKRIPYPIVYSFFMSGYGMVSAFIMLATLDIQVGHILGTVLAIASGTVYLFYIVLYFAALSHGDAAVVVAFAQISPIFSLFLGLVFLGERFSLPNYIGVGIITLGAFFLSLERDSPPGDSKAKLHVNKALKLMLLGCIFSSVSQLLLKLALDDISVENGFFWPRLGVFGGALVILVFPSIRQQLRVSVRGIGVQTNVLILVSEIFALGAVYALTLAFDRGPLALVSTVPATQILFIMFFVWTVNRIQTGTIPDVTDPSVFVKRLMLVSMIICGVYLLSV